MPPAADYVSGCTLSKNYTRIGFTDRDSTRVEDSTDRSDPTNDVSL